MTALPELIRELRGARRIAIVGGPRTGKTTLANKLRPNRSDGPVIHTDVYSDQPWSDIPELVEQACSRAGAFLLEGVQVARCLRKGLEVDAVIFLAVPKVERTAHQTAMAKGVEKIFNEWRASPGPKPKVIYL